MMTMEMTPTEALKEFFGFSKFKGAQEEVVQSVLDGRDTFVIMPTGGGKSLCYQLPALMQEGTAVVVSPLIALMKNQVDALRGYSSERGTAHFLNSSLTRGELQQVRSDVESGVTKVLYVAPESLTKTENIELLKRSTLSFFAIDEAHCISEWGHDFRPEYRRLREIFDEIGRIPLIALTATATEKVQEDIIKNLNMTEANLFKASFNRDNLFYQVMPKLDVNRDTIKFVKQHTGKSGIVYCLSRKKTEEIAEALQVNGIKALPYHAGMDASQRAKHQDMFLMEDVDVIVATIAFGMGIDKPDVRFVIHHDIPKSLESYYQETGRAGRDGGEGRCLTFYAYKDIEKLEKFLQGKPIAEQEVGRQLLHETVSYAETSMCRRKFLLHYFGEEYEPENCGACDNCEDPKEKFDAREELTVILNAVLEGKEKHKAKFITDLIIGNKTSDVKKYKGDKMKAYGVGKEEGAKYWNAIIRQAVVGNFLSKNIETYGLLSVSELGKRFLKKPYEVIFSKEREINAHEDAGDYVAPARVTTAADETLFKMLKDLRAKEAKKVGLPPYVIFQDPSLEEMTTRYPVTMDELTQVSGVGPGKAKKFGKPFVAMIESYVEENNIERTEDVVVRTVAKKSGNKVHIIQNIDRKTPLEDIANAKGLSIDDLVQEMESIVMSGTKLDLNHYLGEMLDEDAQEDIMDHFREAESDSIEDALEEFDGEFSEEEMRLMRIKFLSEVAN